MIPCITNKCIALPACKNKTLIRCQELHEYFQNILEEEKSKDQILDDVSVHRILWNSHIVCHLPNLVVLSGNNGFNANDLGINYERLLK